MDTLQEVKFVSRALSGKGLLEGKEHLVIEGGHIRASNGVLSMGCPFDFPVTCAPHAAEFAAALAGCQSDSVSLELSGDRLVVSSSAFRSYVRCRDVNDLFHPKPGGRLFPLDPEVFVTAAETLLPFAGTDSLRPWAMSVLLSGQSAYATNNVLAAEYWLGVQVPHRIAVPTAAVKEMLRVKEPIHSFMVDEWSMTVVYTSGKWIKTQLANDADWPEIAAVLDHQAQPLPIPEGLFEAAELVSAGAEEGRVYFIDGEVRSSPHPRMGAAAEVPRLPEEGIYNNSMLQKLRDVATAIDFNRYPQPALFFGDRIRGALMGYRA